MQRTDLTHHSRSLPVRARRRYGGATLGVALVVGCAHPGATGGGHFGSHRLQPPGSLPLSRPLAMGNGITRREATYRSNGITRRIWITMPRAAKGAQLPCVLIGPAGAPPMAGIDLGKEDAAEQLPYARAGFAVVSFDIDGAMPRRPTGEEFSIAVQEFEAVDAGIADARAALDCALAREPAIAPNRIYAAGHSSAATLALLLAEHEPRIRACIAYAPVCFVADRIGQTFIDEAAAQVPNFREFVSFCSPDTNAAALRCPLFLFHASEDPVVPTKQVSQFAQLVQQTNHQVDYVEVPGGDHYYSMLRQGIPRAIPWLKAIDGRSEDLLGGRTTLTTPAK